jgi:hypothetical protein
MSAGFKVAPVSDRRSASQRLALRRKTAGKDAP